MMKLGYEVYKNFIQRLLERLKDSLGEGVILSVSLFGSVARGQARPDSDIDLFCVHKGVDFNLTKRFVQVTFELEQDEEYKRLVEKGLYPRPSCIFFTEQELWDKPHILLDMLYDGIILCDTGILQSRLEILRKRLEELGAKKTTLADGTWYWDLKPDWKPGEVITL